MFSVKENERNTRNRTVSFVRQKKRLYKNQIRASDNAVREIVQNPEIGTLKVGDLSGVRVFKFKMTANQILLAYEVTEDCLYLYAFGSHENFYRELKKYIRNI